MSRHTAYALSLALCFILAMTASPLQAQDAGSFAGNKPGQEWHDNKLKMKFCWCPPGKFVMGSPKHEEHRYEHEKQVSVTLPHGFWMGKYEVTQDEWQRVMATNPSRVKGKTQPVPRVSWDDALKFCEKLTELERQAGKLPKGWEYKLPTESQSEKT